MKQREEILKELNELNSSIGDIGRPAYGVPEGYFSGLADQILKKIRMQDASDATKELEALSPLLNSISRTNPFSVPGGYFGELSKNMESIASSRHDSEEAIDEFAITLDRLKHQPTYTVPAGYFENLPAQINAKIKGAETKVVPFARRTWVRYAAAAVVVAFVATFAFVLPRSKNVDPDIKSYAWVEKNLKKVSTDDITEFVEQVTIENPDIAKLDTREEVSSLLKDVSDKEIEEFLQDTQVGETGYEEDQILN